MSEDTKDTLRGKWKNKRRKKEQVKTIKPVIKDRPRQKTIRIEDVLYAEEDNDHVDYR